MLVQYSSMIEASKLQENKIMNIREFKNENKRTRDEEKKGRDEKHSVEEQRANKENCKYQSKN